MCSASGLCALDHSCFSSLPISIIPRHQFLDPVLPMAVNDGSECGERIDSVELARLDERSDSRPVLCSCIVSGTTGHDDAELRRDDIQSLGHVLSDAMQAAATGADQAFRLDNLLHTNTVASRI